MRDVLEDLDAWIARGDRVALATVAGTTRSAPRPLGAKLAVNDRGEVAGAVSGGCVEGVVVRAAEGVLAGGDALLLRFGIVDAVWEDVGLPCGGEIDVYVERWETGVRSDFAALARTGGRGALVTDLRSGAKLLALPDGATRGTLGSARLDRAALAAAGELMWVERSERREVAGAPLFVDVVAPPPRLLVLGAVDVAAALCTLARAAGWRPCVIDPRRRFATAGRLPDAEQVVVAWPEVAFARLGGIDRATSIAVLTHDPKLDDAALTIALRSDAAYVGAMGSRRAHAERCERLLEAGLAEEELARLHAPIGLDLGAVTTQETALSIMAEVVAVRNGRGGSPLAAAGGRIHEPAT